MQCQPPHTGFRLCARDSSTVIFESPRPRPFPAQRAIASALSVFLMICTLTASAAPRADLWPRWVQRDASSIVSVDHGPWASLLARYVRVASDGVNRFDYAKVTAEDRALLQRYLDQLANVPISQCNAQQQMAYWINLYNALTVKVILDHFPVQSIRDIDISPGLFADGPWGRKLIQIEGEAVSLDDIEHRILRPIWKDPRVHYALNCASIGCPNLAVTAFSAKDIEQQLDAAAMAFVNHPRAVAVSGDTATVSSIYEWFKPDFGGDDRSVLSHLKQYANAQLRTKLQAVTRIRDHHYDWALNKP